MSLPVENLIQELNSLTANDQEKVIRDVPWIREKLINLIQTDLISMETENIFDEITKTREFLFSKYGEMFDCTDLIREDRAR